MVSLCTSLLLRLLGQPPVDVLRRQVLQLLVSRRRSVLVTLSVDLRCRVLRWVVSILVVVMLLVVLVGLSLLQTEQLSWHLDRLVSIL